MDRWITHTKVWRSQLLKQPLARRRSTCLWLFWIQLHASVAKVKFQLRNSPNTEQNSTIAQSEYHPFRSKLKSKSYLVIYLSFPFIRCNVRYVVMNLTRATPDLRIPQTDDMKGFYEIIGFTEDTPKILHALATHSFT